MLVLRVVILVCTIVLTTSNIQAQDSLMYEHPMIELISTKLEDDNNSNIKIADISSIDQLALSSSHLQSNGPDLLTTLLIRGMGSRHTAILWNGWNLQSPVNGVLDLSLVASSDYAFDIRPQSASTAIGNAAVAGAVILEQRRLDSMYVAQVNIAQTDFGNSEISAIHQGAISKLDYRISGRLVNNENAFEYKDFDVKEIQENANKDALDGNINIKYRLAKTQNITGALWLQNSQRQISATKTTTYKNERQDDRNIRGHLAWNMNKTKLQSSIRMGYLNEYIGYTSDLIKKSTSDARTWLLEGISKRQINSSELYLGAQVKRIGVQLFSEGAMDGFDKYINRNQASLWVGGLMSISDKWSLDIGNRVEIIRRDQAVWTFHVAPKVLLFDTYWSYRLNSVFQQATVNDLYWPQGGNINLNNESGIMQELSAQKQIVWGNGVINIDAALFSYRAKDWIIWSPNDTGFWSPENRRNVLSQGADVTLSSTLTATEKCKIDASVNYIYTHAVVTNDDNIDVIGKQLLYVPRHKFNATASMEINSWRVSANTSWVGRRYTTNDNSEYVNSYLLTNASILKEIQIFSVMSTLSIDIHNLLNVDYEIVKFYANPLRTITFAATFKI